MNREQKINRVLAGLSHTGYTTEIEKCEARLLIEELQNENEKLNHYKLLYQKVKERNDKAIELVEDNIRFCENDSQGHYDVCNIRIESDKKLLNILKG